MKRPPKILIAWLVTAAVLTVIGFLWQSYDMDKIRDLDYTKYARPIMQRDDYDMDNCLRLVKKMMKDNDIEVLEQFQPAGSIMEVVGQSHRNWLESNYYNKVTIVDAVVDFPGQPDSSVRKLLVFDSYIETGSKAYLSIVLLCALVLLVFTVKSEHQLPLKITGEIADTDRFTFLKDRHLRLIFIIALALRLGYMILMLFGMDMADIGSTIHDSGNYLNAAQYIQGHNDSGQFDLYLVGPGYASLLALFNAVFGSGYIPLLILQIFMGSLSCLFIYKIAWLVTNDLRISFISGLTAAFSTTGITLSNAVLGETLFLFLFSQALTLWFQGLKNNRWRYFILSGVIFGLAVLTRSVLLYFPAVIIALAFLYRFPAEKIMRKKRILQTVVTVFLMLVISFSWGIRNKAVHDTFTISGTGRLAAKLFLANEVLIRAEGRHVKEFADIRDSLFQDAFAHYSRGAYTAAEKSSGQYVWSAFKSYPLLFIKTYFMTMLKNITAVSSIQHLQLPQYNDFLDKIDNKINRGYHNPLVLVFSLAGFVLLARRNLRVALLLLLVTGYFALLSGVTFAQGSRIFFPAIITQSILVSITLLFLYNALKRLLTYIISRLSQPTVYCGF